MNLIPNFKEDFSTSGWFSRWVQFIGNFAKLSTIKMLVVSGSSG